ncbi:MAG: patatin-like phospholipase family protein [Coriobacteriales bacterium]|jgi:predicted patatin/cPLA2 family phospholipase
MQHVGQVDDDLLADEFRRTLPIDPTTGERPLFVPSSTPGYKPAYYGHDAIDANLVLEGGSMRVQFTCGVLDFFSDVGLFPKHVIGVSAGALSGFNYIVGARGRTCALNIGFSDDKRYMSLWSFFHTGNAFNVDMSFRKIPYEWIPYKLEEFTESPCKLTVVASNIETNKAEYFDIDNPIDGMKYMQASSAMPFVSQIVEIDGKKYLDGGVTDTIPVDYSIATGVEKQIVVLTNDRSFVQQRKWTNDYALLQYREYPEFAKAVTTRYQLVNDARRHCMELADEGKIFLIMPPEKIQINILESNLEDLYRVYELGYRQAWDQWDDLQMYLGI